MEASSGNALLQSREATIKEGQTVELVFHPEVTHDFCSYFKKCHMPKTILRVEEIIEYHVLRRIFRDILLDKVIAIQI